MGKNMDKKLSNMISKAVTNSMKANINNKLLSAIVAEEVTTALSPEDPKDIANRASYYIGRSFQEVADAARDVNFELGNILSMDGYNITNIITDSNNNVQVSVTITFKINDARNIAKARTALADCKIGSVFSKYISVSVAPATNVVALNLIVTLPPEYVSAIGGDDFKKRPAAVDKEINEQIKNNFVF